MHFAARNRISEINLKSRTGLAIAALVATALVVPVGVAVADVAACSPTETTYTEASANYTVQSISEATSAACAWAIPADVTTIDILVVGAGGGGAGGGSSTGGRGGGGGGGGGGVGEYLGIDVSELTEITVETGMGGAGGGGGTNGGASAFSGSDGGDTTVTLGLVSYTKSGGKGGSFGGVTGGNGGNSGNGNTGASYSGTSGGQGGSSAGNGVVSIQVNEGTASSLTGTSVIYGNGGGGALYNTWGLGATTAGSGGRGARGSLDTPLEKYGYTGAYGKKGLVVIRYVTPGPTTLTVDLNAEGGSVTPTSLTYTIGDATGLTLPTPERTDYEFLGWYTAATGGTLVTSPYIPTEALTLHAQWNFLGYRVTYDEQGGAEVSDDYFQEGGSITLPAPPIRDGYRFLGWYLASEGGDRIASPYSPAGTAAITIYAQWIPRHNQVKFDTQGGRWVRDTWFPTGGSFDLPAEPRRDGYIFNGWFLDPVGGESISSPFFPKNTADMVVYAQWTGRTYSVFFDEHGGSTVPDGTYQVGGSIDLPAAPTREHYEFLGWFANRVGGGALSSPYTPRGHGYVVLHAQWRGIDGRGGGKGEGKGPGVESATANPDTQPLTKAYTIFFAEHSGSYTANLKFRLGEAVALPPAPIRPGYEFLGWYLQKRGGAALGTHFTPTEARYLVIHAKWRKL